MDDYKLKIHNSFSSKVESYDAYAKIQKVVAERMIERFTPLVYINHERALI